MAAMKQISPKMGSAQLRSKAKEFLNSRKHADNLADILEMFEAQTNDFVPLLLTIELIFTELLRRGDLIEEIVPLKSIDQSPEAKYTRWLRDCYETAVTRALECITRGHMYSRLHGVITASKLLQAEGKHPLESSSGFYFPSMRLKNIFITLLDSEQSMSGPIGRFQEYAAYRDVQQYGLKVLSTLAYCKSPTDKYMQNYLELLEVLLLTEIPKDTKSKQGKLKDRDNDEEEEEKIPILCGAKHKAPFPYNPGVCRRYANRCWSFACQWPLRSSARTHSRALVVLVGPLMPLLTRPQLATDMLCDSLDAGSPINIIALKGVLELVWHHNISYPDIYDRLYAMFEPEMFATRHRRRLMHLTDIFLSSTHLPESIVSAFAKRIGRLALLAASNEALALLQLLANLLLRHPPIKRMLCPEDCPAIMSSDPYIMEETCASRSRALGSSLWEVAALRRHHAPAVALAAARLLASAGQRSLPLSLAPSHAAAFDEELKKRFKTIEMNFIRPQGMTAPSGERLRQFWELTD